MGYRGVTGQELSVTDDDSNVMESGSDTTGSTVSAEGAFVPAVSSTHGNRHQ
jgi:hypothetical protein